MGAVPLLVMIVGIWVLLRIARRPGRDRPPRRRRRDGHDDPPDEDVWVGLDEMK